MYYFLISETCSKNKTKQKKAIVEVFGDYILQDQKNANSHRLAKLD